MPKFKVTITYAIYMTEVHEVEFDEDEMEALEEFHDGCPSEYTSDDTLKEKTEGDCLDGSWETKVEEINVLDRIVDALVEAEKETT